MCVCGQLSLHTARGFQAVLRWSVASLATEVVKVSNQVNVRFVVVMAELWFLLLLLFHQCAIFIFYYLLVTLCYLSN